MFRVQGLGFKEELCLLSGFLSLSRSLSLGFENGCLSLGVWPPTFGSHSFGVYYVDKGTQVISV